MTNQERTLAIREAFFDASDMLAKAGVTQPSGQDVITLAQWLYGATHQTAAATFPPAADARG